MADATGERLLQRSVGTAPGDPAADPDGQGRHSFTAQQQTLRRLHATFGAFFKGVRASQKAGYPRFKPYQRFDQVQFVAGDGARWEPAGGARWAHATFQAVGRLKVKQHRQVVVKTLQLKREYRRWYVIVVVETEAEPLPPTGRAVGVDVGVVRFLTTSDGAMVANPGSSTRPRRHSPTCSGGARQARLREPQATAAGTDQGVA